MNEAGRDNREEIIKQAMSIIEKKYGKGAIMFLSQNVLAADVEVIKTGSILLNIALGVGGKGKTERLRKPGKQR